MLMSNCFMASAVGTRANKKPGPVSGLDHAPGRVRFQVGPIPIQYEPGLETDAVSCWHSVAFCCSLASLGRLPMAHSPLPDWYMRKLVPKVRDEYVPLRLN